MSSLIYSLSREIEMTAIDAEVEAECYQEDWYEIDIELKEKVVDMLEENFFEQF